jgi:hypothetical protein
MVDCKRFEYYNQKDQEEFKKILKENNIEFETIENHNIKIKNKFYVSLSYSSNMKILVGISVYWKTDDNYEIQILDTFSIDKANMKKLVKVLLKIIDIDI